MYVGVCQQSRSTTYSHMNGRKQINKYEKLSQNVLHFLSQKCREQFLVFVVQKQKEIDYLFVLFKFVIQIHNTKACCWPLSDFITATATSSDGPSYSVCHRRNSFVLYLYNHIRHKLVYT